MTYLVINSDGEKMSDDKKTDELSINNIHATTITNNTIQWKLVFSDTSDNINSDDDHQLTKQLAKRLGCIDGIAISQLNKPSDKLYAENTGYLYHLDDAQQYAIYPTIKNYGIYFDSDIALDTLQQSSVVDNLHQAKLILIDSKSFVNGRSFSLSKYLKQHYSAEIRIAGNFGIDQLAYLKRSGVDSFVIKQSQYTQSLINALSHLAHAHHGQNVHQLPMFRSML